MKSEFEHPLETTFNIAPGSVDFSPIASQESEYSMVPAENISQDYQDDAEDIDITQKIETIYDTALEAYQYQVGLAEIVEPRYAARNAEVAAQYLNIALNATSLKSRNKSDKRKSKQFIPFNNTNISNSNVVVADRNEILRLMAEKRKQELDTAS